MSGLMCLPKVNYLLIRAGQGPACSIARHARPPRQRSRCRRWPRRPRLPHVCREAARGRGGLRTQAQPSSQQAWGAPSSNLLLYPSSLPWMPSLEAASYVGRQVFCPKYLLCFSLQSRLYKWERLRLAWGGRLLKEVHSRARDSILEGVHLVLQLLGPAFVSTGVQGPLLDKACPFFRSTANGKLGLHACLEMKEFQA